MNIKLVGLVLTLANSAFAVMKVEQVKNGQAIVSYQNQELSAGGTYVVQDQATKSLIEVQVTKQNQTKAIVKIKRGTLQVGNVLNIQKRMPASVNQEVKKSFDSEEKNVSKPTQSKWTLMPAFFSGSADGGSASGIEGTSTSSSATGFGLGVIYEIWLSDISVGVDYAYNSYSVSGGGSATGHDFGLMAGLLLPDLNLKLLGSFYFFGQASAGGATASGMSGFKLGANYFVTNSMSVFGHYKSVEYSSASASGLGATAVSLGFKGFNLGVGFHF